jgi:hypothetical protein
MGDVPRGVLKPAWLVWLFLSLILAGYVASIVRLHPTNFFGATEDDSIYFSSAKALAEGRGYILPSVPGTPPATKYPILYPLILSAVWKLNPSFPANLPWAIAITVAFGFVYIVTGFFFLRRLQVLHDAEVLLLTAFCAFHPVVLFYSASVLSDIPFAALALVAMLLADSMLKPAARPQFAVLCGVVAGLSMMMRMFGLAIVAGVLLAAVVCRAWKQMLLFAAAVAPFFLFIAWRTVHRTVTAAPVSADWANSPGWVNAWAYYTSYYSIWKVGVPSAHIFGSIISNNLGLLIIGPADLFLSPLLVTESGFVKTFAALLFFTIVLSGIARQAKIGGWKPIHYILPLYAALIVFWNYPDAGNRFLLPFAFLLVAGAWIELRNIFFLLQIKLFARTSTLPERALAVILSAAVLFVGFVTTLAYTAKDPGKLLWLSQQRGSILTEKREAYQWLADKHSREPVLAYEDANVYLYSGQTAMRPVLFATSAMYDSVPLNQSLSHVMDIGSALNASYWLFSQDDYSVDFQKAADALKHCLGPSGPAEMPLAFSSMDGHVVIRSLRGSYDTNLCKPMD